MKRALTEQEKTWLLRGLNTLATGEYSGGGNWIDAKTNELLPLAPPVNPQPLIDQMAELQVIEQCNCGEPSCHTIRFQHFERRKSKKIVFYHTEDKRLLLIFVNRDSGLLAELEIID